MSDRTTTAPDPDAAAERIVDRSWHSPYTDSRAWGPGEGARRARVEWVAGELRRLVREATAEPDGGADRVDILGENESLGGGGPVS